MTTTRRLGCPRCAAPMQAIALPARHTHRGKDTIEVDHCGACRLSWFDPLELDTLDRAGWVALLQALVASADAAAAGGGASQPRAACPRCREGLVADTGQTSFGRFPTLACPQGHGLAQHDGALLASRGLFRPLLLAERVALATERRALACLNCGAPLDGRGEDCAHCKSPALVVDLPRLAGAIGLAPGSDGTPTARGDAPVGVWSCHGCGAPLDATREAQCRACAHPVLAPALRDLAPMLAAAQRRADERATTAPRESLQGLTAAEQLRVARLTGRAEHRPVLERLEGAFGRRLGLLGWAIAAVLLLMTVLSVGATSARAATASSVLDPRGSPVWRGERPADLGSPAWAELLTQPVPPDGELPFHAAVVADRWGRADEGDAIRRGLLLEHLRRLGGHSPGPAATVGELLERQLGRPPSNGELALAHDAALDASLLVEPLAAWPASGVPAAGWRELGPPGLGLWVTEGRTRIGAHVRVRHGGALPLAPPQLRMRITEPAPGLVLDCEPSRPGGLMAPASATDWWCASSGAALPSADWAAALLRLVGAGPWPARRTEWQSGWPASDEAVAHVAEAIAGPPPPGLDAFLRRNESCARQGTCAAPPPKSAARIALEAERARKAEARARRQETVRSLLGTLSVLAWLLIGVTVHVVVARHAGAALANIVSGASGLGLVALYVLSGHASGSGLAGLVLVLAFGGSGFILAPIGHFVYRRFFAGL